MPRKSIRSSATPIQRLGKKKPGRKVIARGLNAFYYSTGNASEPLVYRKKGKTTLIEIFRLEEKGILKIVKLEVFLLNVISNLKIGCFDVLGYYSN